MKSTQQGWLVINECHPYNSKEIMDEQSFAPTRMESISKFISGSGSHWDTWERIWNFKCVKVTITIETL